MAKRLSDTWSDGDYAGVLDDLRCLAGACNARLEAFWGDARITGPAFDPLAGLPAEGDMIGTMVQTQGTPGAPYANLETFPANQPLFGAVLSIRVIQRLAQMLATLYLLDLPEEPGLLINPPPAFGYHPESEVGEKIDNPEIAADEGYLPANGFGFDGPVLGNWRWPPRADGKFGHRRVIERTIYALLCPGKKDQVARFDWIDPLHPRRWENEGFKIDAAYSVDADKKLAGRLYKYRDADPHATPPVAAGWYELTGDAQFDSNGKRIYPDQFIINGIGRDGDILGAWLFNDVALSLRLLTRTLYWFNPPQPYVDWWYAWVVNRNRQTNKIPPSPVLRLDCTPQPDGLTLISWTAVPFAASYKIYFYPDPRNTTVKQLLFTTTTTSVRSRQTSGTFGIAAVSPGGESPIERFTLPTGQIRINDQFTPMPPYPYTARLVWSGNTKTTYVVSAAGSILTGATFTKQQILTELGWAEDEASKDFGFTRSGVNTIDAHRTRQWNATLGANEIGAPMGYAYFSFGGDVPMTTGATYQRGTGQPTLFDLPLDGYTRSVVFLATASGNKLSDSVNTSGDFFPVGSLASANPELIGADFPGTARPGPIQGDPNLIADYLVETNPVKREALLKKINQNFSPGWTIGALVATVTWSQAFDAIQRKVET